MSNQTYEFDSANTALWAANSQLRAVNGKLDELLSCVCVIAESLRANEDMLIYASALGAIETVLEVLHEDTLIQFVVPNEPIQADLSHDKGR